MGYDIALFFHITGVLTLFVATALEMTALLMMRQSRSVAEARTWSSLSPFVAPMFPVAIVLIIGAGLYMLHDNYGSAQPWAMTALVIVVALTIVGFAFNAQRTKAIHDALQEAADGPLPGDIGRRIHDPLLLRSIQTMTTMIVGIVLLMTVKPELRDALIIVVVAGLAGLASSQAVIRRQSGSALQAAAPEYAGSVSSDR